MTVSCIEVADKPRFYLLHCRSTQISAHLHHSNSNFFLLQINTNKWRAKLIEKKNPLPCDSEKMEEDQGSSTGKKKKVMVAIDESECSHYALDWALQNLSNSIANSDLFLFTVQPIADYSYLYASSYGATPPELVRNFQENQKKVSLALLEKAKDICSKYGVVAETMTEAGNPKETICETVEKLHIQLLILGSHSKGALKRVFLGSVSNYCVHHAKCPVLVVRKPI